MSDLNLARSLDRWASCTPQAVSTGSPAQMFHFVQDAQKDIAKLGRVATALQDRVTALEAENERLRNFVGMAQGIAMGVAMSGESHPNPDEALMKIFKDGQDLLFPARSLLDGSK